MFFWVVVARWGYAEVKLGLPDLIPSIDYALEQIQIPTHDHWPPKAEILAYANRLLDSLSEAPQQQPQVQAAAAGVQPRKSI